MHASFFFARDLESFAAKAAKIKKPKVITKCCEVCGHATRVLKTVSFIDFSGEVCMDSVACQKDMIKQQGK